MVVPHDQVVRVGEVKAVVDRLPAGRVRRRRRPRRSAPLRPVAAPGVLGVQGRDPVFVGARGAVLLQEDLEVRLKDVHAALARLALDALRRRRGLAKVSLRSSSAAVLLGTRGSRRTFKGELGVGRQVGGAERNLPVLGCLLRPRPSKILKI